MPPIPDPIAHSKFTLNTAGVAGFFGGDEAISAMATVHLYKGRRWLGWFNSPGSYTIAKCFGKMANSRFWDGLFPGHNDSPAVSFGLDGREGPEYIAALSGTKMRAGHLAYLAMERSKEMGPENLEGRVTAPCDVAYLAMKHVDYDTCVEQQPLKKALYGLLPITISVTTCVMCALVYDWLSFSMILLGIISSGCASVVIGRGRLVIKSVKEPARGAPPGHGILIGKDGVMVIKGEERDVNAITKGRFVLETTPKQEGRSAGERHGNGTESRKRDKVGEQRNRRRKPGGERQGDEGEKWEAKAKKQSDKQQCYHAIGICSLVLLIQFLLQLLLIPQGTLFGQIMFLVSLGASWMYNSYLSSLEKEKIQARILFQALGDPRIRRFRAGTRTSMAVFACLLLFHKVKPLSAEEDYDCRIEILEECLPNKTKIWRQWRQRVVDQLGDLGDTTFAHLKENEGEPPLLKVLLLDARTAFEEYFRIRGDLPDDSAAGS